MIVSVVIAIILTIKFKKQLSAMERKGKLEIWILEYDKSMADQGVYTDVRADVVKKL